MIFTPNNASFDKNNNLSKVKKDISTIQSEVTELSEEISSIDNDLQDYKQTVANEQSGQNSQINANLQSLNNLQQYTENYVEQNKELIETQVLRAREYIESPLHRIVETETILENQIYGDEEKIKKIIINHRCSKKYIDIQGIGASVISFNQGALKILTGNTRYSSRGYANYGCICVENNMIAPITYGYKYNNIYAHTLSQGGTEALSLYFVMEDSPIVSSDRNELFIDYIIISGTTYTKETFMNTVVESDEALYSDTQLADFTKLKNGYHIPYGYFYDINGKINTYFSTGEDSNSFNMGKGQYLFNSSTKGDIHTIKGFITTSTYGLSRGVQFTASLIELCKKTQSELLQDLDLYLPLFKDTGSNYEIATYLHITTSSDNHTKVVCEVLGNLAGSTTFYIGQTTFFA